RLLAGAAVDALDGLGLLIDLLRHRRVEELERGDREEGHHTDENDVLHHAGAAGVTNEGVQLLVESDEFHVSGLHLRCWARPQIQGKRQSNSPLTRSKLLTNAIPSVTNAIAEPIATVPMRIEYSSITVPRVSLHSDRRSVAAASFIVRPPLS